MGYFDYSGSCGSASGSGKVLIGLFIAALAVFLIAIFFFPILSVGIQAQLTGSGGVSIADGAPVLFNAVLNNTSPSAITYVPATGTFIINDRGTYLITWWVAAGGTVGPAQVDFAVEVNGVIDILGSMPLITGQVNGSALVTVTNTPTTITLVNATGAAVSFALTPVQANITITRI